MNINAVKIIKYKYGGKSPVLELDLVDAATGKRAITATAEKKKSFFHCAPDFLKNIIGANKSAEL